MLLKSGLGGVVRLLPPGDCVKGFPDTSPSTPFLPLPRRPLSPFPNLFSLSLATSLTSFLACENEERFMTLEGLKRGAWGLRREGRRGGYVHSLGWVGGRGSWKEMGSGSPAEKIKLWFGIYSVNPGVKGKEREGEGWEVWWGRGRCEKCGEGGEKLRGIEGRMG